MKKISKQKPEIVLYADELLGKKINVIDFGYDADLFEVQRKTVWMYNIGSAPLKNIKVTTNDDSIKVTGAPGSLDPMNKGPVTLEWIPIEEKDIKATLEVTGSYPERRKLRA